MLNLTKAAGLVTGNNLFGRAMVYYAKSTTEDLPKGVHSWIFQGIGTSTASGKIMSLNLANGGGDYFLNYHGDSTSGAETSKTGGTPIAAKWVCMQWEYNGSGAPVSDEATVWADGVKVIDATKTNETWDLADAVRHDAVRLHTLPDAGQRDRRLPRRLRRQQRHGPVSYAVTPVWTGLNHVPAMEQAPSSTTTPAFFARSSSASAEGTRTPQLGDARELRGALTKREGGPGELHAAGRGLCGAAQQVIPAARHRGGIGMIDDHLVEAERGDRRVSMAALPPSPVARTRTVLANRHQPTESRDTSKPPKSLGWKWVAA